MMIPFAGDEARIGNGQMGQNGTVQSAAKYRAQLSMQNPAFTQSVASLARRPMRSASDLSLDKVAIANRSIGGRQGGERRMSVGSFVGDNSIRFYCNNPMDTANGLGGPQYQPSSPFQPRQGVPYPAFDRGNLPMMQADGMDGRWQGPYGGGSPLPSNGQGGPTSQSSPSVRPRQGIVVKL